MASKNFQFKQFTVSHELCAMKVGTDGVLLGAWTHTEQATQLLDVGTGSGLIALMLAQRSNGFIDAIDIDRGAYEQALLNANNSIFSDRIKVFHTDIQSFFPPHRYDVITCNPPFFSNSLKSPDQERTTARHNDTLPFEDLSKKSASILKAKGTLSVILPFDAYEDFHRKARQNQLFLTRRTIVFPTPESKPKRVLLEYSPSEERGRSVEESQLVIELERHVYSNEYIQLTREFYLRFM